MTKIFVVGGSKFYASWIASRMDVEFVDSVDNSDLVIFTGGEDVDPKVYGDSKHRTTYSNIDRDILETAEYKKALSKGIPMLGICRGSQFLTAMQPQGLVIQDVSNHTISHAIRFDVEGDDDDSEYPITSTHHQMMYPFSVRNYLILAYASPRLSRHYELGSGRARLDEVYVEPEIVWYPTTKCFCIQGHPEMMPDKSDTVEKIYSVFKEYTGVGL